jgi:hypothetical protein
MQQQQQGYGRERNPCPRYLYMRPHSTSVEDKHAVVLDQRQVGLWVQRRNVGRVVDRVRAHGPLREPRSRDQFNKKEARE